MSNVIGQGKLGFQADFDPGSQPCPEQLREPLWASLPSWWCPSARTGNDVRSSLGRCSNFILHPLNAKTFVVEGSRCNQECLQHPSPVLFLERMRATGRSCSKVGIPEGKMGFPPSPHVCVWVLFDVLSSQPAPYKMSALLKFRHREAPKPSLLFSAMNSNRFRNISVAIFWGFGGEIQGLFRAIWGVF